MDCKIVNFIIRHNKYKDRKLIKEYLEQHRKYGTLDYGIDEESNIVAVVRWNINGDIADVLDFSIRKDFRNKGLIKDFIKRAMVRFPEIKYISFKRGVRGDHRIRKINVDFILKRNIF